MPEHAIFAVHAVRPESIDATELVCTGQVEAEDYARALSTDPGVLGAAVTRFVVDQPGRRTALALFVHGERQTVPWISDDRRTLANGRVRRVAE